MQGSKGMNDYRIEGDVAIITLKRRDGSAYECKIDLDDLQRVIDLGHTWSYASNRNKYASTSRRSAEGTRSPLYMHRFILNYSGKDQVDHINNDGLDNRKSNLRLVNYSQNGQNRSGAQINSKSGIRGVSWKKNRSRWVVHIGGKDISYHRLIEDAETAAIATRAIMMTHSREAA